MKLTQRSAATGNVHTVDLPISNDEYVLALYKWQQGAMIQDAFPTLSQGEREFIKSGITAEEWDAIFEEGEEQ